MYVIVGVFWARGSEGGAQPNFQKSGFIRVFAAFSVHWTRSAIGRLQNLGPETGLKRTSPGRNRTNNTLEN